MELTINITNNVEEAGRLVLLCNKLIQSRGEMEIELDGEAQKMKEFIQESYKEGHEVVMRFNKNCMILSQITYLSN